ncbi:hypothetical protein BURMUCF2_2835 [Burkholderia multivorans CF2]|nr:hypothetical protein BURMUCF2_2835 [Burkholderia multivorans CF2]
MSRYRCTATGVAMPDRRRVAVRGGAGRVVRENIPPGSAQGCH